jgi:hypothetical protein
MKKLVMAIATMGAIAALALVAGAAQAGGGGAQKLTLLSSPDGSCFTGATGGTATGSFAVINFPSNGTVGAEVAIKDAPPNDVLTVNLVQVPSGTNCFSAEVTVTTNGQGKANVHISDAVLPDSTGAFVQVFDSTFGYNVDTMAASTS